MQLSGGSVFYGGAAAAVRDGANESRARARAYGLNSYYGEQIALSVIFMNTPALEFAKFRPHETVLHYSLLLHIVVWLLKIL